MTATAEERGRGINRVLAKINSSIESGNYYEAHQMYRTLYFRYTRQREFDECLDVLYFGIMKLVYKEQQSSAADLGLLLVDTLEKRGNNSENDVELWVGRLGYLIAQFHATTVERETFINRAIKWSGDISGNTPLGHPKLHKLIADVFWKEGNYEQARHHYLISRDGDLCGRILIKINKTRGYESEIDLFIVQAVLQQLCLKDRKTAEDTFVSYTTNHPQIKRKEAPFKQPLLNFIHFLFRCIDNGRLDSFRALCDLYKPSLSRDPSFEKYLTKVSVHLFGAAPPQTSGGGLMGGMFSDLFSSLFQDFEDDADGGSDRLNVSRPRGAQGGGASQTNELD